MNSMSKGYYNDDCSPCRKERHYEEDCSPCKQVRKPSPTVIRCGTPSATTIPVATVAGTTFTVSSVTIDNSGICNPVTKLEFASNLVAAVAFTGSINFQVFKLCRGQFTPVPVGPAWTFNLVALLVSETFSFFVCDCSSCFDECCTYTVVATVTSPVTVGTLSINNATLGAITTSGTGSCC